MTTSLELRASSLDVLVARMRAYESTRHPLGLSQKGAEGFVRDVQRTGDVGAALTKAGLDPRLGQVLTRGKPGDAVAVVSSLLPRLGEVEALRLRLRGAALYPVVLLVIVGLSGYLVDTLASPNLALAAADTGGRLPHGHAPLVAALMLCAALLVALAASVRWGVGLPLLTRGAAVLDRALVLEAASTLHEAGVALPLALTAASGFATGGVRDAGERLGHALGAGGVPGPAQPLLEAEATGILAVAAGRGVASQVLRALAVQARLAAERQVPDEVSRVTTAALLIAGAGLLAVAVAYYSTYLGAVLG